MGTRYKRDTELPTEIIVVSGQETQIEIPHIYSDLIIGNQLDINLRQVSALDFISMARDTAMTIVTIDATGIEQGHYELSFESFDAASQTQSTLKTDQILVRVQQPEVLPSFVENLEAKEIIIGED